MTELRIALLGSGYMGGTYAECISKYNQRGKLVAVSGGRRAPGLAERYEIDYVAHYDALLARNDVDAVLIATPHSLHREQVVQAAAAGKHVLIEKPMATSVADCDAMIAACQTAGVRLEVIQTLRFRGTPARAKALIDDGAIGPVQMIQGRSLCQHYVVDTASWAALPENGGAFLDMGVHNFDIMRFWSGAEVSQVFSQVTTYGTVQAPGLSAMTQLAFTNGVMGQQWTSFEIPAADLTTSQHRYWIVGATGVIDVDGYGKIYLSRGDQRELIWEQPAIDFVNRPLEPSRLEAFYTQTQAFIDDVLDARPATVSGADGRAAVAIVEAAWASARTGQAVAPV
ncbi:MAG: Gfo/Idh/MocA family oxidoreductase [Caldilineaceae bacterium]